MLKLVAADLLQGEQKKDVSIGDQKRVALKELNYSMLPAGVTKEETPQKDRKGWENWWDGGSYMVEQSRDFRIHMCVWPEIEMFHVS